MSERGVARDGTRYRRETWSTTVLSPDETLPLPEVDAVIAVDSIYEGIFPMDAPEH